MSETPRVGDVISVTLTGKYNKLPSGAGYIGENPGRWIFPSYAKVEILERADDPSKDPIGTVRKSPTWLFVKTGHRDYPWYGLGNPLGGENDRGVVNYPVVGVVPGSPADKPAVPEAEYYQGVWRWYRVQGDKVEVFDREVWYSSIVKADGVRRFPRLDSDPTESREFHYGGSEPPRDGTYKDAAGDTWHYSTADCGWRFSSPNGYQSRVVFRWDQIRGGLPWNRTDGR